MILRQFCARHGRSAVPRSLRSRRSYATKAEPWAENRRESADIIETSDEAAATSEYTNPGPTAATRQIEDQLEKSSISINSLEATLNAHISAHNALPASTPLPSPSSLPTSGLPPPENSIPPPPFPHLSAFWAAHKLRQASKIMGTVQKDVYNPKSIIKGPPRAADLTLPLLLASQTHLGHHTSLWHPSNSRYITGIRHGIHIIDLDVTFSHLRRAAKVVQEVAYRGDLILYVGTRGSTHPLFADIVIAAAKRSRGYHIFTRWTAGTLTNAQQLLGDHAMQVVDIHDTVLPEHTAKLENMRKNPGSAAHAITPSSSGRNSQGSSPRLNTVISTLKPSLVVVLNCPENQVCLHECALQNIPTIGIVDTDVNPSWVTYQIPANDDSWRSVALVAGVLSRAAADGNIERLKYAKEEGKATWGLKEVEGLFGRSRGAGRNGDGDGGGKRGRNAENERVDGFLMDAMMAENAARGGAAEEAGRGGGIGGREGGGGGGGRGRGVRSSR